MNVLFMTIAYPKAGEHNIYTDLMREFVKHHHNVYIACSNEKRNNCQTAISDEDGMNVLRIRTGNLTGNVHLIEKGLSTLRVEGTFIRAIKEYFKAVTFDLILYSTPPITFAKAVRCFKKRDNARSYLLLKDIFPQNAADIGMMKNESLLYHYFRGKEKKLYAFSDFIGCMSKANVDYLIRHNPDITAGKAEVCPNSIIPSGHVDIDKKAIKAQYQIPDEAIVFMYGGNLGKPQGIDFFIQCLDKNLNRSDRYFVICGNGADYPKLEAFCNEKKPQNIRLIKMLPKADYDRVLRSCDVGLIFLDHRFTIPNFPSRLLSYMEYAIPVLACTDKNTDVGKVIEDGGFGWWCESNDSEGFLRLIDNICISDTKLSEYGSNARQYLEDNYTAEKSYEIIMKHFM